MKNFLRILTLIAVASAVLAGSKTAPDLPGSSSSPIDVIVQYKTPPTKDELKQLGPYGQIKKQFVHLNAVDVTIAPAAIAALEQDPNVTYISPNRSTTRFLDIATAGVNAPFAWNLGLDG